MNNVLVFSAAIAVNRMFLLWPPIAYFLEIFGLGAYVQRDYVFANLFYKCFV